MRWGGGGGGSDCSSGHFFFQKYNLRGWYSLFSYNVLATASNSLQVLEFSYRYMHNTESRGMFKTIWRNDIKDKSKTVLKPKTKRNLLVVGFYLFVTAVLYNISPFRHFVFKRTLTEVGSYLLLPSLLVLSLFLSYHMEIIMGCCLA